MAEATGSCPAHLLQAAQKLMAENGYAAMTMRQLAGRVGVLPGSLYHHVACKQDLLLNVLLNIVERRLEDWEHGAYADDLSGFVSFLLRRQCTHPDEELLMRHEIRHLDPCQRSWLDKELARLSLPLARIIEQGKPARRYGAPDTRSACAAIFAAIDVAGNLRAGGFDESWIEAQALQMCRAVLGPCRSLV